MCEKKICVFFSSFSFLSTHILNDAYLYIFLLILLLFFLFIRALCWESGCERDALIAYTFYIEINCTHYSVYVDCGDGVSVRVAKHTNIKSAKYIRCVRIIYKKCVCGRCRMYDTACMSIYMARRNKYAHTRTCLYNVLNNIRAYL